MTNITCTLHEHRHTFLIISRSIILTMRNVPDKSCRENQNTHFVFCDYFPKIVPFMRKCGKKINIVQLGRTQMAIRRMRIECWIPKATNTHSEYVILIAFFFHSKIGCTNAPFVRLVISCFVCGQMHIKLAFPF